MKEFSLLKYLQKTKQVTRREFEDMVFEKALRINYQPVEDIKARIRLWDFLEVDLWEDWVYQETVKSFPNYKPLIVSFNKPKGYVVSKSDKYNKTIFELLPKSWQRDFYYIWRLDKYSRGLLLLTNDPELVDYYENPKNRVFKIYEVVVDKPFKSNHILKTKKWMYVNRDWKVDSKGELLYFYDINKTAGKLRIVLKEWKNQHIRRVLTALGYKIKDLKRIKVGKYELWDIKEWKYMINKIKRK